MKAYSATSGACGACRSYSSVLHRLLVPRAYTVILFGALFCNLAVKLFHAARSALLAEYPSWILTDLAILLTVEAALALACYRWPTRRTVRGAMIIAAVLCTWSVMNAGWVIRTGTQMLPMDLLSLFRDPLNILKLVFKNLLAMPGTAAVLLIPSAVALAFLFSALARPMLPNYNLRRFRIRIAASLAVAVLAVVGNTVVSTVGSAQIAAAGMRHNCQARAMLAFFLPAYRHLDRGDFRNATRELPRYDSIPIVLKPDRVNHNAVIVVLEGVQYDCTSLAQERGGIAPQRGGNVGGLTPFLSVLASEGASFTNARSVVTHTTKALFALLTGRFPSASQDISETIPMKQPYASLATILEEGLGFRTAFFQSATGTFESRPGLIHNLGFDKFFAREDLHDPSKFVGYLGGDEFAMLDPIAEWIQSEQRPFLLVVLCSVTHDPYEVPAWFEAVADKREDRYLQTIVYTDRFLAALDAQLSELGLADDTIFCVVGDHGEAFSEHRMMGHERIAYDEVLRIVMCLRAPFLVQAGIRVSSPISSVDLTPTILGLLGVDTALLRFDGCDALDALPCNRRVYLSGWMQQGPGGFVEGDTKVVYNPENGGVRVFQLSTDPLELAGVDVPAAAGEELSRQIIDWRRNTIFKIDEDAAGQRTLFGSWQSKWTGRRSRGVKYIGPK